jgi:hypothetical protein
MFQPFGKEEDITIEGPSHLALIAEAQSRCSLDVCFGQQERLGRIQNQGKRTSLKWGRDYSSASERGLG